MLPYMLNSFYDACVAELCDVRSEAACLASASVVNVHNIELEETFDIVDRCGMCTVRLTLAT